MGKVIEFLKGVILFFLDVINSMFLEVLTRIYLVVLVLFTTSYVFMELGVEITPELSYGMRMIGILFCIWSMKPVLIRIHNELSWRWRKDD